MSDLSDDRRIPYIACLAFLVINQIRVPKAFTKHAISMAPTTLLDGHPGKGQAIPQAELEEILLKAGALQNAILNSANFSSIATDEKGVIQLFNVGAERMLGYHAAGVLNKITPADLHWAISAKRPKREILPGKFTRCRSCWRTLRSCAWRWSI
jgi:PAS domain-containing protein